MRENTRLFVAPDWREIVVAEGKGHDFIHCEFFDVDADGDWDWIGARYQPGWIVWLEQPAKPMEQASKLRLVNDQLNGIQHHDTVHSDRGQIKVTETGAAVRQIDPVIACRTDARWRCCRPGDRD